MRTGITVAHDSPLTWHGVECKPDILLNIHMSCYQISHHQTLLSNIPLVFLTREVMKDFNVQFWKHYIKRGGGEGDFPFCLPDLFLLCWHCNSAVRHCVWVVLLCQAAPSSSIWEYGRRTTSCDPQASWAWSTWCGSRWGCWEARKGSGHQAACTPTGVLLQCGTPSDLGLNSTLAEVIGKYNWNYILLKWAGQLVSWCIEPSQPQRIVSQPQRIISGLEKNINPFPIYTIPNVTKLQNSSKSTHTKKALTQYKNIQTSNTK